jgi:hypothetical protein
VYRRSYGNGGAPGAAPSLVGLATVMASL